MNRLKILPSCIPVLLLLTQMVSAQEKYRMPMDIPMQLSGTFGELRFNHFHSGIDIRTLEKEGFPVYAIDDGYVSRIFISPFGFGKAVYINHPDGVMSVYAHLQRLDSSLAEEALDQQYAKQSFSVDFNLPKGAIKVEKGQVIGYSGNTGGSSGPHLHFEMRLASSQHPVNPMAYGFRVVDTIAPVIDGLRIYPVQGRGVVAGVPRYLEVMPDSRDTVLVSGEVYLGVSAFDRQNDSPSIDGPYDLKVFVGDDLWWHLLLDEFSYDETRYVNSLIDYQEYIGSRMRYYLTRRQPYNKLSLYERLSNEGVLSMKEGQVYKVTVIVSDFEGNKSTRTIHIRQASVPIPPIHKTTPAQRISVRSESKFEAAGVRIQFPAYSFYSDTLDFQYKADATPKGAHGDLHCIHNKTVPIHKSLKVELDASSVPESLRPKALIVRVNDDNSLNWLSTRHDGKWVSASIREFGRYTIMLDTIPPQIRPLNIVDFADLSKETQIKIEVSDTQGGVVKYRGTIDGQWVLFEYEPKLNLLFHDFDIRTAPGTHLLKIEVVDDAGNLSVFSATFKR